MRDLLLVSDNDVIKAGDSSETITLSARNDNQPQIWSSGDTLKIHIDTDDAHVTDIDATPVVNSNELNFDSSEIASLPAGKYQLELWAQLSNGKTGIWPSDGMLDFTISRNADELSQGANITTITLNDFKKDINNQLEDAKKQMKQGPAGKSAYELAQADGFKGTEQEWLKSLKGEPGVGKPGADGKSAYDVAVAHGFSGTEAQWLDSLKHGPRGLQGKSAYEVAKDAGFVGTLNDWLKSLHGKDGQTPHVDEKSGDWFIGDTDTKVKARGPQGDQGEPGKDAPTPHIDAKSGDWFVGDTDTKIKAQGPQGEPGKDAVTPHVDTKTGNWFVGNTDTGVHAQGSQGEPGKDAVTPHVDAKTGNWFIGNTDTGVHAQGPQGDQGNPGKDAPTPHIDSNGDWFVGNTDTKTKAQGVQGVPGPMAKLSIGTVTTGAAGSQAKAQIIKTDSGYALNVTIPAGPQGETGGVNKVIEPNLTIGTITTLPAGSKATASLVKTSDTAYTINIGIPAGKDGKDAKDVDLTPYLKITDANDEYAKKSDIPAKVDLTPYLKATDADSKYATKSSVPAVSLDTAKRTITVNNNTINIPNNVDLSAYAKTSDVPKVVYDATNKALTVNGQTVTLPDNVDLSPYLKTADADKKYETKEDAQKIDVTAGRALGLAMEISKTQVNVPSISLDIAKRTLTVNGNTINIPNSVDLSGYAKTSDVPKVVYDATAKTLTVNGQKVDIPASVDLSGYVKQSDLNGYLKQNDVTLNTTSNNLNNELQIGDTSVFIPKNAITAAMLTARLRTYAKIGAVPKITLDTQNRTLTVNGTSINIPDNIDLSPYLKTSDADAKYETKDDAQQFITSDALTNILNASDYLQYNPQTSKVYYTNVSGEENNLPDYLKSGDNISSLKNDAGYTTNSDVYNAVEGELRTSNYATKDDLNGAGTLKNIQSYDKTKTTNLPIVGDEAQSDSTPLMDFLGMNATDQYELNLDEGTLVDTTTKTTSKLAPGFYKLRDNGISNLKVTTPSKLSGFENQTTINPLGFALFPHLRIVLMVDNSDVSIYYAPNWAFDMMPWYGIANKWHRVASEVGKVAAADSSTTSSN